MRTNITSEEDMTTGQVEALTKEEALVKLTEWLADTRTWTWMRVLTLRDSADSVLQQMAELGLIKHEKHPMGGDIWIVRDKKFGRVNY